jgi:hypothetical protein
VQKTIEKMLAKDPNRRFSASELRKALRPIQQRVAEPRPNLRTLLREPKVAILSVLILIIAIAGGTWLWMRYSQFRWVRNEVVPEIRRLIDQDQRYRAFKLVQEAAQILPDDSEVQSLRSQLSTPKWIDTDPPGAEVYMRDYSDISGEWDFLGLSPTEDALGPTFTQLRLKITKPSFDELEGTLLELGDRLFVRDPEGTRPPGMVRVAGKSVAVPDTAAGESSDYWLDRYEVTNEEYKEFVNAGGYAEPRYWDEQFFIDGRTYSWEQAMAGFRDKTGRPGPATWEIGTYPDGEEDLPVRGVSWYEACAFCEFKRKTLPSIYHWYGASGLKWDVYSSILELSNFEGTGPAPRGTYQGVTPYGVYDMAGNVKEWCWNATGDGALRYILGGAYNETKYMFIRAEARSPAERAENFGFRCARYQEPVAEAIKAPADFSRVSPRRDYTGVEPVNNEVFQTIQAFYTYDDTELSSRVEAVDEKSEEWKKERITFDASYDKDRITAILYSPRNAEPPFQTVLYFPSLIAMFRASSEEAEDTIRWPDYIVKSGRALLLPIYKGTFERRIAPSPKGAVAWRDLRIRWSKDLGRSIDYLETRSDINCDKLAYFGLSMGAWNGFMLIANEPRFKAAILEQVARSTESPSPETEPINFAPRVMIPTLILSGRYDFLCPVEAVLKPLYRSLGVDEPDKRLVLFESGHVTPKLPVVKEALEWLDEHLGPVELKR